MTVADFIELPFKMPERKATSGRHRNRRGKSVQAPDHQMIICSGFSGGQPILEVGNGVRFDSVIGAYRHKNGCLVMVSESHDLETILEVVVPQHNQLFFAGFMRPTPEKRFGSCEVGRSWFYHQESMERVSLNELMNIIDRYSFHGMPMAVHEYLFTDLPEAYR